MRKRVYIAGPMQWGDRIENLAQAMQAFRELMQMGFSPLCPQLNFFMAPFLIEVNHKDWLDIDLPWVEVADAILRLPGASVGADMETGLANIQDIPVFLDLASLQEWKDSSK